MCAAMMRGMDFAPTNEQWSIEAVTAQPIGTQLIMIQIASQNGIHVSFLTLDDAKAIAANLAAEATRATSGLILPPGTALAAQNGHHPVEPPTAPVTLPPKGNR